MEDGSANKARWLAYLAAGSVAVGAAYWAYSYTKRLAEVCCSRKARSADVLDGNVMQGSSCCGVGDSNKIAAASSIVYSYAAELV